MFLTGFFWFFNVYQLADTTWLFVAAFVLADVSYGFLIHLLLVFPDGKLETRLERAVVAGGYLAVTVLQLIAAFLIDPALNGCEGCPDNPLLIDRRSWCLRRLRRGPVAVRDDGPVGLVVALAGAGGTGPRSGGSSSRRCSGPAVRASP